MTRKKEEPDDFRRAQHGYPIDSRESEQTTRIRNTFSDADNRAEKTVMVGNLAQRRGAVPHLGHRSVPFAGPLPEPSGRRTLGHNCLLLDMPTTPSRVVQAALVLDNQIVALRRSFRSGRHG